ncbi:arginase family protein [Clostridium sp. C105KSO13]|uniref:arginase family protein n=1 Tax=Clostridium sp. C105KSO13 TaxID=1776045 RepID=UPI00074076B2|nr:arginase family protein [Clostridium sp. C105KSO13]CUX18320.1 Arginase family protein [Clostridium sp. C105KSO13]
MKNRNLVFDFTHSYPIQLKDQDSFIRLDCSNMEGCALYCSASAEAQLKGMIHSYGISGIHFIDSGDYHYITRLMTDYIEEPFSLVLIDHHTDMQRPLTEGLTSCGNWAREVLENNSYLQQLVLLGQEQLYIDELDVPNKEKIIPISYEKLETGQAKEYFEEIRKDVPVYLSIDKDVLTRRFAVTNWDQGEMTVDMLKHMLKFLLIECEMIGIDICGEYPSADIVPAFIEAERINNGTNEELYAYIMNLLRRKK